jgi:hypothetical protein
VQRSQIGISEAYGGSRRGAERVRGCGRGIDVVGPTVGGLAGVVLRMVLMLQDDRDLTCRRAIRSATERRRWLPGFGTDLRSHGAVAGAGRDVG